MRAWREEAEETKDAEETEETKDAKGTGDAREAEETGDARDTEETGDAEDTKEAEDTEETEDAKETWDAEGADCRDSRSAIQPLVFAEPLSPRAPEPPLSYSPSALAITCRGGRMPVQIRKARAPCQRSIDLPSQEGMRRASASRRRLER